MDIVVQENFPEDHTIQIPTSYTTVEFKPPRFIQDSISSFGGTYMMQMYIDLNSDSSVVKIW